MTPAIITGLYVPGDRPDRFDTAVASGADLVILDLEDAVADHRKEGARDAVVAWLNRREPADTGPLVQVRIVQVRINAGDADDLAAMRAIAHPIELRVPKVESVTALDVVASEAPGRPITALIESARGLENAAAIAAHPAVTRLALGESDLASDVGSRAPAVLDYARIRLLFAARAAGLPAPMLSAYPDIRNLDGLRTDTERGRDLGWVGRVAIHPSQLPVIAEVFRPTDAELGWAREVLAATAAGGVSTLANGEMVDTAMVGRAQAVIARAGQQP